MSFDIYSPENVIDSRDIIERIDELKQEWIDATETDEETHDPDDYALSEDDWAVGLGAEEASEMVALLALAAEGRDNAPDWEYGATFIADDYFEEYAKDSAHDVGYVSGDNPMSDYIDWGKWADAVQMDYTSVEVNGSTYWVR